MQDQLLPRFKSIQEYDEMRPHLDVSAFERVAREILKLNHLPSDTLSLFPDGSNIIFAYGSDRVIKIFPPFLIDQFESEKLVLRHLQGRVSIPTPRLEYLGQFENWPYLIMTRVEGDTLESVWKDLDFENQVSLIKEIGSLIKEVHSLDVQGLEAIDCHWPRFIQNQISNCVERHRGHHLNEKIVSQLPSYLAKARELLPDPISPVLLTGEYTPFNLLVNRVERQWALSGMIDFGDCMLGYHEYDLLGPGAFLIQGNKDLLREFLLSYGFSHSELDDDLSHRLTALMLLHRFSHLRIQIRIPDWETKVDHVKDLQNLVWGFSS